MIALSKPHFLRGWAFLNLFLSYLLAFSFERPSTIFLFMEWLEIGLIYSEIMGVKFMPKVGFVRLAVPAPLPVPYACLFTTFDLLSWTLLWFLSAIFMISIVLDAWIKEKPVDLCLIYYFLMFYKFLPTSSKMAGWYCLTSPSTLELLSTFGSFEEV